MGLQQNGSKYFVRSSQTNSGGVSIGQNPTFLKQDQVVYKIKWNHECSNRMANILPTKHTHDPPPPCFITVLGTKGQISTFSVHGHVAYQIKGNQVCSNMVATILPAEPTPPDPGDRVNMSNLNFFQNMVMLHIKLKGTRYVATW